MNKEVYKRTKEYFDKLRAKQDFDWSNQKKMKIKRKKSKKKILPKSVKKQPGIFNIRDHIRISHTPTPPEPRSISRIQSYIPKKTLVTELSTKMLDTVVDVPLLDEKGNNVVSGGNILYKKEKLKDVINKPVFYLKKIEKTIRVETGVRKILKKIMESKWSSEEINKELKTEKFYEDLGVDKTEIKL